MERIFLGTFGARAENLHSLFNVTSIYTVLISKKNKLRRSYYEESGSSWNK